MPRGEYYTYPLNTYKLADGTVQKLAGIPVFSGLWMRLIMFVLVYAVLVSFIVIYAKKIEKIRKNPIAMKPTRR